MRPLRENIERHLARSPEEVRSKLRNLDIIKVNLPPGERAICAAPRTGEWPLPKIREDEEYARGVIPRDTPLSFPMRWPHRLWKDHPEVTVNLMSQPLIVHELVTQELQELAGRYMDEWPETSDAVQGLLGVAFGIGRFDVIIHADGTIELCEIDDMASLWGASHDYNQIVESHVLAFMDRREAEGYKVVGTELPEVVYWGKPPIIRRNAENTLFDIYGENARKYYYQHNDFGGDGTHIPFVPLYKLEDHHLVIARGRRDGTFVSPSRGGGYITFAEYMDRVRDKSLTPTDLRDCKISLAAMNLGVLATKAHAFQAIGQIFDAGEMKRVVVKRVHSARTGDVAIIKRGTRLRSEFSEAQARSRFSDGPDDELVIVQPAYQHETAESLGLQFDRRDVDVKFSEVNDMDRKALYRSGAANAAAMEKIFHGEESKMKVICRIFVLYDKAYQEKPMVIGGLAAGLRGEIVHNDQHGLMWPLFCEGVNAAPDIHPYYGNDQTTFSELERRIAQQAMKVLRSP